MKPYQHILVPVDFTLITASIITRACELARCYQAKVSLLYVLGDVPLGDVAFGGTNKLPMSPLLKKRQIDTATGKLRHLAQKFELPENSPLEVTYTTGKASEAIISFVREKGIDLVIVGNSGKKSVLGFLGSTAEATLKGVSCDIMAVRVS